MDTTWNIGAVARRAGLSAHVLRVWERRYRAVRPVRTDGNQRLYAEEDVERLRLMARLCQGGHRIGSIARLPVAELRALAVGTPGKVGSVGADGGIGGLLARCRAAVEEADGPCLARVLESARVFVPPSRLLPEVVLPLMRWIGERWKAGSIRILHEHVATAVVRALLDRIASEFPLSDSAPCVVLATPPGEWHELGCLAARVIALERGWRVAYLGANVPAAEIVEAGRRNGASVVALGTMEASAVRPAVACLRALRRTLASNVVISAGGLTAGRCAKSAGLKPSSVITSMDAFGRLLDRRRASASPG